MFVKLCGNPSDELFDSMPETQPTATLTVAQPPVSTCLAAAPHLAPQVMVM